MPEDFGGTNPSNGALGEVTSPMRALIIVVPRLASHILVAIVTAVSLGSAIAGPDFRPAVMAVTASSPLNDSTFVEVVLLWFLLRFRFRLGFGRRCPFFPHQRFALISGLLELLDEFIVWLSALFPDDDLLRLGCALPDDDGGLWRWGRLSNDDGLRGRW
jgi:hypothetical protein